MKNLTVYLCNRLPDQDFFPQGSRGRAIGICAERGTEAGLRAEGIEITELTKFRLNYYIDEKSILFL